MTVKLSLTTSAMSIVVALSSAAFAQDATRPNGCAPAVVAAGKSDDAKPPSGEGGIARQGGREKEGAKLAIGDNGIARPSAGKGGLAESIAGEGMRASGCR